MTSAAWTRRHARSRRSRAALAGCLVALAFAVGAGYADAVILPATTVDGPGEDIVAFGGAAMAEDGTGGVVYSKRVEGVVHVFVSRFVGGRWVAPQRVDRESPFNSAWPRIGAASSGQLVVVWATPFATENGKPLYELLGTVLGAGSSQFGEPTIIDPNIGDATGTSPDVAVNAAGQADVVYRVIQTGVFNVPLLRAGDVVEQVRVARLGGLRWSSLGTVNRNPGASMRAPTQANAPHVAIGPTGNGIVVWQEPDVEGIARIWARRIFGSSLDYVMPVTMTAIGSGPISDDADAPAVALSPLGQAEVAYRQAAGPGSPLPGPRILLNILSDGESTSGAQFAGASVADTAVAGGRAASVGPPSIDIDEQQDVRLLYSSNGAPRVIEGTGRGLGGALSLGPRFAGPEPYAASVMNPQGGGVSAWPSADAAGNPAVAVREDFPGGAVQTGLVSGGAGGEVGELAVGRSGLGDGLVAFRQGPFGNAAIVAAHVSAPPAPFVVATPKKWIKPAGATVSWQPAVSAAGPLSYRVVLDGRPRRTPAGALRLRIDPRGLGSGRHRLQVLATDADGAATLSGEAALLIDGTAPRVRIATAGRRVRVRVLDPDSGVAKRSVRVSFGDGSGARRRLRTRHRYPGPGTYLVTVRARDRVGNAGAVRRWVSVP